MLKLDGMFYTFFLYSSGSNVLCRKIAYMISSKAWLFAQVTIQLLEQTNLLEENVHVFIASCIPFFIMILSLTAGYQPQFCPWWKKINYSK